MFNKKKRHFGNNQRPHYTRQGNGPDDGKDTPQDAQKAGEANAPVNNAGPHIPAEQQAPLTQNNGVNAVPQASVSPSIQPNEQNMNRQDPSPNAVQDIPQNTGPAAPVQNAVNPQPGSPQDVSMCPICNMPIRSLNTAVHQKVTGSLVHFDCALRELSREYYPKLGRFKKIYYIGAGNFAVVKEFYDKRGHLKNYEILEKIPYEPKEK